MNETVTLFLKHIKMRDEVGKLIEINLDLIQLVAGISVPILEHTILLTYVEESWLKKLHPHLVTNELKICVWTCWTPKHQQVNDKVLMDILGTCDFSTNQLKMVNQYRCVSTGPNNSWHHYS